MYGDCSFYFPRDSIIYEVIYQSCFLSIIMLITMSEVRKYKISIIYFDDVSHEIEECEPFHLNDVSHKIEEREPID